MIATGIVVFLSAALVLLKLPRRLMLRALRHDLAIDLTVTALVLFVHWGTFSGVMAATFAGLLTSLATSTLEAPGRLHRWRSLPPRPAEHQALVRSFSPSAPASAALPGASSFLESCHATRSVPRSHRSHHRLP